MTSKLDTAGLVEHFGIDAVDLDMIKRGDMLGPKLGAKVFAAIEALTQAAAPDPDCECCLGSGLQADGETPCPCIENNTLAQLSAMQERAERAERERDTALRIKEMSSKALAFERQLVRADMAEVRVAELEAQKARVDAQLDTALLSADPYRHIRAARAALAHKGEGQS
jgi:hypothetical protein